MKTTDARLPELGPEPQPEPAWPLTPAQPRQLTGALKLFAAGATGGILSLMALTIPPNLVEARGATKGMRMDRERQRRCMQLGVTPEELAVLEAREDPETPE